MGVAAMTTMTTMTDRIAMNAMNHGAAITAWAWRTPLGSGDLVLQRLLLGERAARPNARFDTGSYAASLGCAILQPPQTNRNRRFLRRMGCYAVEVAREAYAAWLARQGKQAGADGEISGEVSGEVSGERIGLFFGYGGLRAHWDELMPAFAHQTADGEDAWQRGLALLHPHWMLQHLSNNAHAVAAQELGARGEGATFGGANAGAQALAAALRSLAAGAVDVALVVAYDSLNEPETLVELAGRHLLNCHGGDYAAPYDMAAQGFVPGEAAAALVLQRRADAKQPLGYVQARDGADGENSIAHTATLARMLPGLAQAGDAVDGVGIAQSAWDLAERTALAQVVGADVPLTCMSSALGHCGAASAVVQSIALLQCLQQQVLPPIAGLQHASPGPLQALADAQHFGGNAAIGLSAGTPGLAGVIRVAVERN
jgi:3-oxoacyl-[acyl-carrier-protein] synthase II